MTSDTVGSSRRTPAWGSRPTNTVPDNGNGQATPARTPPTMASVRAVGVAAAWFAAVSSTEPSQRATDDNGASRLRCCPSRIAGPDTQARIVDLQPGRSGRRSQVRRSVRQLHNGERSARRTCHTNGAVTENPTTSNCVECRNASLKLAGDKRRMLTQRLRQIHQVRTKLGVPKLMKTVGTVALPGGAFESD